MNPHLKFGYAILCCTFLTAFPARAVTPAGSYLGRCDYYAHLSAAMNCPADGYLVGFGLHYCQKFERDLSRFTRAGAETVADIRLCLQQRLEAEPQLSCASADEIGPASHVECYVDRGFCEMNFWDQAALTSVVWPALLTIDMAWVPPRIEAGCLRRRLGTAHE